MTESVLRLASDADEIGQRVRLVRKRRGLSLAVVAGLAGISPGYLSLLERGKRGFNQRGLLDDLARALRCSVVDLTGEPYQPVDRDTAEALTAVDGIRQALLNYGVEDIPPVRPRPLEELLVWTRRADRYRDQSMMSLAGRDLGTLLTELAVHAQTAATAERDRAVTALIAAWAVAGPVVQVSAGNLDLAVAICHRMHDLAARQGDPGLIGFARWSMAGYLKLSGARDRARSVVATAVDELGTAARFGDGETLAAEMLGLLHGRSAVIAALDGDADQVRTRLDEARALASRTGERNGLGRHFGPTNVRMCGLAAGLELGEGGRAHAEITRTPVNLDALASNERSSTLHLNLARALVQDTPDHDLTAIRHLDTADRLSPQRIRMNPVARNLVTNLSRRNRRRTWELDSLCNRFGIGKSTAGA